MGVVAAQVTILHESGNAEDHAVNTFHFGYNGETVDDPENIADLLEDFYTATPTGQANSIAAFMATTMLDGDAIIRLYNLNEDKPRAPVYERTFSLGLSGTTTPIPPQCAVVLTYETAPQSGQVQRRFRNRVYLPYFKSTVVDSDGMVSGTLRTVIAASARDMLVAAAASIENDWKVFSPTRAAIGGTPDSGLSDVDGGWVDDSWDIQRRRKVDATTRTTWSSSTP